MRYFVLAALLLSPLAAFADDPQFGSCWANGKHCVGPRVAAPAMAIDVKTGDVSFGFQPGFGYGYERNGTLQLGIAWFVSVRETAEGARACPAVLMSLYRYVHIGPAVQLGTNRKWFLLLTLGSDLGMARAAN